MEDKRDYLVVVVADLIVPAIMHVPSKNVHRPVASRLQRLAGPREGRRPLARPSPALDSRVNARPAKDATRRTIRRGRRTHCILLHI